MYVVDSDLQPYNNVLLVMKGFILKETGKNYSMFTDNGKIMSI